MSTDLPILHIALFAGGIVLIVVIGYFAEQARKKRLAELAEFCSQIGFQFYPEGLLVGESHNFLGFEFTSTQDQLAKELSLFSLFQQGHSRRAAPVMKGAVNGHPWMLFDYEYKITTSNGKETQTTTYPFTVCVVQVPFMLPVLSLEPENWLHGVGKVFGSRELQVESAQFNKSYYITSSDPRAGIDLLHPIAIERLLNQKIRNWKLIGPYLMVYSNGHQSAAEYSQLFIDVKAFVDVIPAYFKQDHGFGK